jgi:hypothetical protein
MIYSFRLPDDVLANGKRPYDSDYHVALLFCATRLKRDWNYNSIVTASTIFVDIMDDDQYKKFAVVVGELTASINRVWPTRMRIVFEVEDKYRVPLLGIHHYVERTSKAEYELYMENYALDPQPSLFSRHFCLSYEKTPTFFREGTLVDERVLS